MGLASAGIGSGLDVTTIVSQLMAAEQAPLTAITTKQTVNSTKLSAYGTLKSGFASFQTAIKSLSDLSKIQAVTTTSSDTSVLSATSASGAVPGDYSVQITQLAQAQKLVAAGQASDSAAIGTGVLSFDFGSLSGSVFNSNGQASKSVTIDASCNTLSGIRDAINAASIGVNASIVNDGGASPYRLLLSNTQTGAANQMKISVGNGSGGAGSAGLTALLTHNPSGSQTLTQTVAAQDAHLTVDGLAITKSSNSISDVVPGITLTLKKLTGSTPASLSVARDTATVTSAVQGLVDGYNTLMQSLKTLSSYDLTAKKGAALNGDSLVRSIQNQLRSIVTGALPASGSNLTRLNQIGITMQATGSLALDSAKLKTVIDTQFDKLPSLFATTTRKTSAGTGSTTTTTAATGTPSDPLVSYVGASSATQSGSYALSVNQLATSGSWVGGILPGSTSITAGVNDNLQVTLDGQSASVTLAAGSYTQAALASAVQTAINSNSTFVSAGSSVSAGIVDGALSLVSARKGVGSGISLAGTAASTLITGYPLPGTATTIYQDASGSINGVAAVSDDGGMNFIGASGTSAAGMVVHVEPTASAGSYALNVSQLARQGSWQGGFSIPSVNTITAGLNDQLEVTLNGLSASVTLAPGTYARTALASAIQNAINNNSTFATAGSSVSASIVNNALSLVSTRYGASSDINLGGTGETDLINSGSPATTASGQDVAGTFDGVAAVASGVSLFGATGTPAQGISVTPGTVGSYAINVSAVPRPSSWLGQTLPSNTTITTGVNDTLQATIRGISANVTLPPGTYTPADLAWQVSYAIITNSAFQDAETGTTTLALAPPGILNNALYLTTGIYGPGQSIELTGGNALNTLINGNLPPGTATTTSGQGAVGTINGIAADVTYDGGGHFLATPGLLAYVLDGTAAAAGNNVLNISQLAAPGSWLGQTLPGNTTITAGVNANLQVTYNRVSDSVTLAAGSYTPGALAAAVQFAINRSYVTNHGLAVNGTIVNGALSVTTGNVGPDQSISLAGTALNTLTNGTQLPGTATTTSGRNVSGTINGVAAVGTGYTLWGPTGTAAEGLTAYTDNTPVAGSYTINLGQLTTPGSWLGQTLPSNTTITTGVNDTLQVTLNGQAVSLTLAPGTYTPQTLATAVQTAINDNPLLSYAGVAANIVNNALKLTTGIYGPGNSISLAGNAVASLSGFGNWAVATSASGQNMSGQINGAAAVASGQTLTGASGNAAEGLSVNVYGGSTGSRGTITYTSASTTTSTSSTTTTSTAAAGFAAQLNDLMSSLLSDTGMVSNRTDGISKTQRRLDDDKIRVQARLAALQQSYQHQFTQLDTIMSKMNSTSSALTQQLAALAKSA